MSTHSEPESGPDFTPTERSRARRVHERAHYDRETLYALLDAAPVCHLGYVIDGQPFVTPTFQWREGAHVYFHGSSASRMLRTVQKGLPVCLTVTLWDGLVLARSGFHCSVNYRSAMLFGTATAVTDDAEKTARLKAFIEGLVPGRWDDMREPNSQEMKATTVCALEVEEASVKIRTGPPKDDEEDYTLDCWAGVIPIRQVPGQPVPDPRLKADVRMPAYVRDWSPE